MSELALRYRPQRFGDVAGQKAVTAVLYRMVRKGTLPHALLFTGPAGTGKTSMARIVGAALNCEGTPGIQLESGKPAPWPCGDCPQCKAVQAGNSLDVLEIDAASNGGVENVRQIRDLVLYGSPGLSKLVILDEAHSMSSAAFNALLKILEEPPPGTVFVLITTEPGRILKTVASRCMPFPFARITPDAIAGRLAEICAAERVEPGPGLLQAIAEHAGGMRDAVVALDQMVSTGITDLRMYLALHGRADFAPALLRAAVAGRHDEMFGILDEALAQDGDYRAAQAALVNCLRDVLVLQAGGKPGAQGDALAAREHLATSLSAAQAFAALRVLWDLATRTGGAEPRAMLELAAVMIAEKLARPGAPAPAPAAPNGRHARMSMADLQAALVKP